MIAPSTLFNSFYIGITLENILYGVELALYFETMRTLLRNGGANKRSNSFYALFSSIMVFLVTVWVAIDAIIGQKTWLLHPDFPGGPYAYWRANLSDWYMNWLRAEIIILQLMTDALMIYRCRMIWNSNCVVAVPIILWLATFTLGALVVWHNSSQRVAHLHLAVATPVTLIYWSISVFLNTVVTCMICYRVLRDGWKVQEHLGKEYASLYFTVVMTIVESVLPYTLTSIAFLVSSGLGSPAATVLLSVYFLMMCISPQLLILRVVVGRAWDNDTFNRQSSTIRFDHGEGSESNSSPTALQVESTYKHCGTCLPDEYSMTRGSEV